MIYDIIEEVFDEMVANFQSNMQTILAEHSQTALSDECRIYKRIPADVIKELRRPLPAMGIYWTTGSTSARNQQRRNNRIGVNLDYVARGADGEAIERQCELAVEGILRVLDTFGDSTTGTILSAGHQENTIVVNVFREYIKDSQQQFLTRALVAVPVTSRDVIA